MTNKSYKIECISIDVHKWGEYGEGEYITSKGGYIIREGIDTIEQARAELNDYFGFEVDDEYIDGDLISVNQIEDENGYRDDNGQYIADYMIKIFEQRPVVFNDGI
jgi:hypothetical protein